ncbi:hypothetical protein GCM10010495_19690 [Kitasatospora herbaricolor]|uniref:hypothetical protein n=1 Tax=Kitasatospora herbaricolor TaxID=68217 RepID=UPI00174CE15D|nr:hypothetical protein [Kitasatospora herbaricolor]MDQ0310454.1 hypothetical protein [Kitasatospora herbaricolor]GGV07418.1 hypothetical protein GCM10010495_19690 [Kitasatospora herbaricolor]
MRKYGTEVGLTIVVSPQLVGRQKDLETADVPRDPACHIYVVSQANRISILPESVTIANGICKATARRQVEGAFNPHEFSFACTVEGFSGEISWHAEYPYEDFSLADAATGETIITGNVHTLLVALGVKPEWTQQEILYIGQAFGKTGERQAFDRLSSHSTLQKIYSEQRPDRETWLTLCAITDVATLSSMHPTDPGVVSHEEDMNHLSRIFKKVINNKDFNGHEGVAIAEAGLIRHFQPKYNIIFKNNFPDPQHVSLSECLDLEVNMIILEFHGINVHTAYGSPTVNPSGLHFPQYPLFEADGRASLLDFMEDL